MQAMDMKKTLRIRCERWRNVLQEKRQALFILFCMTSAFLDNGNKICWRQ